MENKIKPNSKNMPTEKELTLLTDLLTAEENLYHKYKIYAKITTNVNLMEKLEKLKQSHEQKVRSLFELL